jgi:hypothetical protein
VVEAYGGRDIVVEAYGGGSNTVVEIYCYNEGMSS